MKTLTSISPRPRGTGEEALKGMARTTAEGAKNLVFLAYAVAGLVTCVGLCGRTAQAQTLEPGQKVDPMTLEWPRFYATNGYEFAVYQPCISKWPGNQLEGRLVV